MPFAGSIPVHRLPEKNSEKCTTPPDGIFAVRRLIGFVSLTGWIFLRRHSARFGRFGTRPNPILFRVEIFTADDYLPSLSPVSVHAAISCIPRETFTYRRVTPTVNTEPLNKLRSVQLLLVVAYLLNRLRGRDGRDPRR